MSNEKNQRDDASNPDLPSIRRALRGEDEFKPVFPELQSQNDERVAFVPQTYAGFAAVHLNESGHPPDEQQSFDAGVRAGLARATQQATKGDERAAFDEVRKEIELIKGGAKHWPNGWSGTGDACDAALLALARATTPSPVAGSAGQAPVARPMGEWHEDHGNVVWFTWQDGEWLGEPSYIGQPNDSDWPGYHTHWTPHPAFPAPARTHTTQPGESVAGIALRQCGSEAQWRRILQCNPDFEDSLPNDYFPVGTVLMLPTIDAPTAPSLATDAGAVLTDEQIAHIAAAHTNSVVEFDRLLRFARALLAAHPTEQRMSDAARGENDEQ